MARLFSLSHYRLPTDPVQRGMLLSIIEGCAFTVWAGAVQGNYLTGAALHLGAGGVALGLLGALPSLATMLQIVCAPFVLGLEKRRTFLAAFSGMQRIGACLAGLAALWLLPPKAALIVFVACQMLAWALMAPPTVVWHGYMTDLVPVEIRGRYFARRAAWCGLVGMLAVMAYGAILDIWSGTAGFTALYLLALLAAVVNLGCWFLHPELPAGETRSARPFWETVRIPLTTPGPHRVAALFFCAWAFAQGLAAPFYPVALMQKLGLSFSEVSVLATVTSLTGITTSGYWGRLHDRIGQVRTIGVLTAMLASVPFLFLLAGFGGWPVLLVAHLLQGTAAVGLGLATQTLTMRLAPMQDRGTYFAFFAAASGITGFLTPALVGALTSRYLDVLFLASAAICALLSLVWRLRVKADLQQGLNT